MFPMFWYYMFFSVPVDGFYTEEPIVKMLTVSSVADRYPAAASGYRQNLENGYDEDAQRTEGEILNEFPEFRMMLNPGGCGFYQFPLEHDQKFCYVQPAKKQGDFYQDYCDKAAVSVEVSTTDGASKTSFRCFEESSGVDPCSSSSCQGDMSSLEVPTDVNTEVKVKVCTDADARHLGSIWEVNFSSSNESNAIGGLFEELSRERLRGLSDVPEFNTQLSLVSIVGNRGVGKSTVASLLSGNSSMFATGSGSIGTTTTGADLSTVIPAIDWSETLSSNIGIAISAPGENLPMFLIDSEGMGVRGSTFDFITTSPPAVIAKVIIWIGTENLQTAKILLDIDKYLKGLDNIVMEEESRKEVFCSSPSYGHFIVVINKMMGNTPDDLLQRELMEPEPDYIEGSTERNQIRKKLQECFDGVTVHGLPTLTVHPGEDIDYPILDGRFKDGLGKIAQSIMQRAETPRIVTVAGMSRELNASNAEVIIGTVIEEANKGQIDLTGFDSFWTYIKQDIISKLGDVEKDFNPISDNCEDTGSGYHCSMCVCFYRNSIIDGALAQVSQTLELARSQALSIYGVNLDAEINDFYEDTIDPWDVANTCVGDYKTIVRDTTICDISEMFATLNGRSHSSDISCSLLFICGNSIISTDTMITTDGVYVAEGASFQNTEIGQAQNGADATVPGGDGGDGSPGVAAPNFGLTANYKLPASSGSILFTSKGGSGGNGGNGKDGQDRTGNIPAGPATAKEVTETGVQYDYSHTSDSHCGGHCHTDDEYWYFKVEILYDACGGNGGQGGNGGAGGAAGLLNISGDSGLTVINNRLESSGGTAGSGSPGASGLNVARTYLGWHRHWEDAGCHGFGGLVCGPSYHDDWGGYSYTNGDSNCPGEGGTSGTPGTNWKP